MRSLFDSSIQPPQVVTVNRKPQAYQKQDDTSDLVAVTDNNIGGCNVDCTLLDGNKLFMW
jgi:hypothetical protein